MVGVLGGYTTFSTFGYETLSLMREGSHALAAANAAGQLLLGPGRGVGGHDGGTGDRMKIPREGQLLRVFVGESDRWHGKPLYEAIVQEARHQGLAGATVFRGFEGYGAHSRIHTSRILRLSEDLPILVEIVDAEDKIQAFLPRPRRDGAGGPGHGGEGHGDLLPGGRAPGRALSRHSSRPCPSCPRSKPPAAAPSVICAGRRLVAVSAAPDPIVFERTSPRRLVALRGREVVAVRRRGKHLWMELDRRPRPAVSLRDERRVQALAHRRGAAALLEAGSHR